MDEWIFERMSTERVSLYRAEDGPEFSGEYGLSKRAYRALRGASSGDRVRAEISYSGWPYYVERAERITGTLEERVERLEARLEAALKAAGIDIPKET